MEQVLQALYNGDISPLDQYRPRTEEYNELRRKYWRQNDQFMQALSQLDEGLAQEFDQLLDKQFEVVPLEMSEMFIDGFRLGARLMLEVFDDKNLQEG